MYIGFVDTFLLQLWTETCLNAPPNSSQLENGQPYYVGLQTSSNKSTFPSGDSLSIKVTQEFIIQFDWEFLGDTPLGSGTLPVGYTINNNAPVIFNTPNSNGQVMWWAMNVQVVLNAGDTFTFFIGPTAPSLKRKRTIYGLGITNFMAQYSQGPDLLQAIYISYFNNPVSDQGSRAHKDIIFWCPYINMDQTSYFYLGMYPQSVTGYPDPPVVPAAQQPVFTPLNLSCLSAPISFELIWSCIGKGQASNLGIFQPVAPPGFTALGSVATSDYDTPPDTNFFDQLRCVKTSLCQEVTLTKANLIWTDQGSGAPKDVSVWLLPNAGCCIATVSKSGGYPDSVTVWDLINPPDVISG